MSSYSEKMADVEPERRSQQQFYMEDERPITEFFKFLYEYFEVANKWSEMQRFSGEHPVASVFLIVTLAAFTVPVAVFMLFVIASVVFSFLGFLLFEGTVLAFGTFILGGVLFFLGLFAVGFSLFLVAGYYALDVGKTVVGCLRDRIRTVFAEPEKEE